MTYTKNSPWANLPLTNTPLSAQRLNHMETQYDEAVEYVNQQIADNPGPQGPAGQIVSVTATPLAPGTNPTVTLGGSPEQRTIRLGIPSGEKGESATEKNPYLGQATLYSYGHSFTSVPNNYCRPNAGEHPLRIKDRLGMADVKAFGRGGTPLPDTLANALNNSRVTDIDRSWPGTAVIASINGAEVESNDPDANTMPRGIVTIQNYINEIGLGLTDDAFMVFWRQCLRSLIATVSGKFQRSWDTSIGGTGWVQVTTSSVINMFPKGQLPEGALFRSNVPGDYREFRVRGDSCWVVVYATKAGVTSGSMDVYVGNKKIQTISPSGMMPASFTSVIDGTTASGWPLLIKVGGLNAAAGTSGWKTIRLQVAAASSTYMSTVVVERNAPPEVLVAYEPTRKDMTAATWDPLNAKFKKEIDTVVSEFNNAHVVDLDMGWDVTTMTAPNNFHPNDRGQANMADNYVREINALITNWTPSTAVL